MYMPVYQRGMPIETVAQRRAALRGRLPRALHENGARLSIAGFRSRVLPMSRTTIFHVDVQWGDCDPADIVFFPNFQRWIDAASLDFFHQCGLPRWRELEATRGIIGTPMLEINTRFYKSATYGDHLEVHTTIERWDRKVFVQYHRVVRDKTLL